jgi:uncharacterized protein (DUF924 family)
VLDQFPRNIHRGRPRAFAHDDHALRVTRRGVADGHLEALTTMEQAFLLMPFQHCEDLDCQREGMALFERLLASAPPPWRSVAENVVNYARLHLELIERFGRFSHRNAILGRTSTRAELEYLNSGAETFGQSGATPA